MRIGVKPPHETPDGAPLSADQVIENARMVEETGLDGIWKGHHVPVPGDPQRASPDPLAHLLLAALGTERVELGTCIYTAPLGNAAELAQRFYTLQSFAPDRCTFGLGTGSQELEYEHAGLVWSERFTRLDAHLAYIRSVYETRPDPTVERMFQREGLWRPSEEEGVVYDRPTVPNRLGAPRFLLGAWHSPVQLARAVDRYDGWIASAGPGSRFGGWRRMLTEGITRYRDLGGRRALVTTVMTDLRMPDAALPEEGAFHLLCGPRAAAERLQELQDLGYDDVILSFVDRAGRANHGGYTAEMLEQVRSLLPVDGRDYRAG